jgi:hypothetical protein
MSPDEWLMMAEVEKLMGRTLMRETVPGFEPAISPLQPRVAVAPLRRSGRSVRPRQGALRRR